MNKQRMAVIGIGATGSVLSATLLSKYPETILIVRDSAMVKTLQKKGLHISGAIQLQIPAMNASNQIQDLKEFKPDFIFLCTKTFHLGPVLQSLMNVFERGTKIISTQNGLGIEDLIAGEFGEDAALRMSLNFGASYISPGQIETTFFNRPNHLGCMSPANRELGDRLATMLTDCGLDTEFVDDIKLFVWKKMIMKCTMASICAVTDMTIKQALEYPPTRAIADGCFKEALAVAKSMGYDLGEDYLKQAIGYLQKVGVHKDSMCYDIKSRNPTEIDFLGAKIVEYASAKGLATPFYATMTGLVKAIEKKYLDQRTLET